MRGRAAQDGDTRVSANGYHYTREAGKWRLTHHIVAEKEILRRPLRSDERVHFIGKKTDLSADNIQVLKKATSTTRKRIAVLKARIADDMAELKDLESQL